VAVQGYGNVGSVTALALARYGAKIVAITDVFGGVQNAGGLDLRKLDAHVSAERTVVGFPEAEQWLPHAGCVFRFTGNPIDPPPDIRPDAAAARARWGFPPNARVLLVFGGSQGAGALNRAVAQWIDRGLPGALCLIWATGRGQYDAFRQYDRADVRVVPYLSPIADAYAATDLAFVRGGMMGTSELCAWGVPMIVCPLPTAAKDHQTANAVALAGAGAAIHMPQSELTPERLDEVVHALISDPERMRQLTRGAASRARPHAAADIAGHIEALLKA
jgi:UDP-N-acetylglucosamine--N-acetylmuramyl-(pentapeptide) pyrophosphoryl-undecaprenol N-acetylglucosamine transferase